jgi:flagellar biosynthesis/type III secretory pathway M-ring protein FliF/YscJ
MTGERRSNSDEVRWEALSEEAEEAVRDLEPGEPLSPSLMARAFRALREGDPVDLRRAEEIRDRLHETAELGDEVAAEVLRLLSDDPWWQPKD